MTAGFRILARSPSGAVTATHEDGTTEPVDEVASFIRAHDGVRWVWDDTTRWYPALLAQGVRVERCHDLRLSHVILRNSALTAGTALATAPAGAWDEPFHPEHEPDGLFELAEPVELDVVGEFRAQQAAIAATSDPGRIGRLIAAESAGALVAAELTFAGLPWRADVHDRVLTELLGERPPAGERPARLAELTDQLRELLGTPDLNPDSQPALLKALANAGLRVSSTARWELRKIDHPVIAPLLEYKKLARLLSANGWHWLDTWVADGRFRPTYVPGGVVTGRWASDGGGALQLPKEIRSASVADPGWKLVVADASQLEPRVLAGMARDDGLAKAGLGDLYDGIVSSGAVDTRDHAKVAMLAAMYGATTGDAARIMPRLARAYPRAIGLVEEAARAGERGEIVTTTLGRSSPLPGGSWRLAQSAALEEAASEDDASRARGQARAWGRFTRNFVVQGSAAEWALCWMGSLRGRLQAIAGDRFLTDGPHLVFFLHDEVVIHSPEADTDAVVDAVRESAAEAGRLLFGATPITFPLTVAVVDDYAQAK